MLRNAESLWNPIRKWRRYIYYLFLWSIVLIGVQLFLTTGRDPERKTVTKLKIEKKKNKLDIGSFGFILFKFLGNIVVFLNDTELIMLWNRKNVVGGGLRLPCLLKGLETVVCRDAGRLEVCKWWDEDGSFYRFLLLRKQAARLSPMQDEVGETSGLWREESQWNRYPELVELISKM